MKHRLNKEDWVAFGLKMLALKGPASLKADVLAAAMKVSRGSFYWHFENLAAFHSALLSAWVQGSTEDVIARIEEAPKGEARLDRLLEIAHFADPSLERGMRAWAASNPEVAKHVEQVDRSRLAYLAQVLTEAGWPKDQAEGRALLLYLSNLGRVAVSDALVQSVDLAELQASARYAKP